MTDRQFERATEINNMLQDLKHLKQSLQRNIRVTINFDFYKYLREPFIDVIEGKIAELKAEYENL